MIVISKLKSFLIYNYHFTYQKIYIYIYISKLKSKWLLILTSETVVKLIQTLLWNAYISRKKYKVWCYLQNSSWLRIGHFCTLSICLDTDEKGQSLVFCVFLLLFFSSFFFLNFILLLFLIIIEKHVKMLFVTVIVHGTVTDIWLENKRWVVHTSGSRALFMGPTNLFFQQLFH